MELLKVDTLEKIVNAFGVKHIDITRDTKIIYVEGITDYNYFKAFKILMEHIENREINTAFMPINGVGRPNDERKKNDIMFCTRNGGCANGAERKRQRLHTEL